MSREKAIHRRRCCRRPLSAFSASSSPQLLLVALLLFPPSVSCQRTGGNDATDELISRELYKSFANFTDVFKPDIKKHFGFCITDVDADWNAAFNFSTDPKFISSCAKRTKGDMTKRLCTAAEMKFYFNTFFQKDSHRSNYLQPNRNCNLTSWVSGCEPGWACSAGQGKKVDLKNSKDIPARTTDCDTCCEGFFCPHGLTCMIRKCER